MKITVKKLSDFSLLVGKKIVQIQPSGTLQAVTELTVNETRALNDFLIDNSDHFHG